VIVCKCIRCTIKAQSIRKSILIRVFGRRGFRRRGFKGFDKRRGFRRRGFRRRGFRRRGFRRRGFRRGGFSRGFGRGFYRGFGRGFRRGFGRGFHRGFGRSFTVYYCQLYIKMRLYTHLQLVDLVLFGLFYTLQADLSKPFNCAHFDDTLSRHIDAFLLDYK
jgi:hypothetical protein